MLLSRPVKRLIVATVILVMMFGCTASIAYGKSVTVKLPTFKVTLNGKAIDNKTRKYPLILYKDITYFPMTYHDSRFLGLETDWNAASGLVIRKSDVAGGYVDDLVSSNKASGTASIPTFSITVNGKAINNSNETYPLLNYKDVTYFPLTWRFAVDEFGWTYNFDAANGLVIQSSANSQGNTNVTNSMTASLPLSSIQQDITTGLYSCVYLNNYFYYVGTDYKVYQAPAADTSKRKAVYTIPDQRGVPTLTARNGHVYLLYGGATVTAGVYMMRINEDGTAVELPRETYEINGTQIQIGRSSISPWPADLKVKTSADSAFRQIGKGNVEISYGTSGYPAQGAAYGTGQSDEDVYLVNGFAYVLGEASGGEPSIYKVNISTGVSEKITTDRAYIFYMRGDRIYYLNGEMKIVSIDLNGKDKKTLVNEPVRNFVATSKDVFYADSVKREVYRLSDGKAMNPGGELIDYGFKLYGDSVVCYFQDTSTSQYKKIIIGQDGNVVYQGGERADKVMVSGNMLIYLKQS